MTFYEGNHSSPLESQKKKKKKHNSNLENLPEALARPQLLQAACRFKINNPSGNFFSGPRLTALERELILDWTPGKS